MVPFENLGTVSYSHFIATVAVSLAVSTQYTNVTDTEPPNHRTTTKAVLITGIVRQKAGVNDCSQYRLSVEHHRRHVHLKYSEKVTHLKQDICTQELKLRRGFCVVDGAAAASRAGPTAPSTRLLLLYVPTLRAQAPHAIVMERKCRVEVNKKLCCRKEAARCFVSV